MTDFLDHFIARTVDASVTVRPRPISLFEPAALPELPEPPRSATVQAPTAPPARTAMAAPATIPESSERVSPPQPPPIVQKMATGRDRRTAPDAGRAAIGVGAEMGGAVGEVFPSASHPDPALPRPAIPSLETPPERQPDDVRPTVVPQPPHDGTGRPAEKDASPASPARDDMEKRSAVRLTAENDAPSAPVSSLPAIVRQMVLRPVVRGEITRAPTRPTPDQGGYLEAADGRVPPEPRSAHPPIQPRRGEEPSPAAEREDRRRAAQAEPVAQAPLPEPRPAGHPAFQAPSHPAMAQAERVSAAPEATDGTIERPTVLRPHPGRPEDHDAPPRLTPRPQRMPAVAEAQPPTRPVFVTIGRVEVRATSGTPANATRPRPQPVMMSLDDYLAQRTGEGS